MRPARTASGTGAASGARTSRYAWWKSSWSAKMFGARVSLIAVSPKIRASCSSTTPVTVSFGSQVRPSRNRERRKPSSLPDWVSSNLKLRRRSVRRRNWAPSVTPGSSWRQSRPSSAPDADAAPPAEVGEEATSTPAAGACAWSTEPPSNGNPIRISHPATTTGRRTDGRRMCQVDLQRACQVLGGYFLAAALHAPARRMIDHRGKAPHTAFVDSIFQIHVFVTARVSLAPKYAFFRHPVQWIATRKSVVRSTPQVMS